MSKCRVCDAEIKRGMIYKGDRYKNIPFCSKECYNAFLELKDNTPKAEPFPDYNDLLDYIQLQWGGNDNVNWMLTAKQIKTLVKKHGFTCKEIRMILKYAIEIEGEYVDVEYGIGQFLPKYIEGYYNFVEQIKKAKELAENMEEEKVVIRKISKQVKKVKEEEWD